MTQEPAGNHVVHSGGYKFSINNPDEPYPCYSVNIRPCANGFIVAVGCKDFVFEDRERMLQKIGEYYSNPAEVEKKFRDGMLILKY